MNKITAGIVLLAIGVIVLVAVYSMRPPSGFGEALMMMGQGRQTYIKEPLYQILMAVGGVLSLVGIVQLVAGLNADKKDQT